MVIFPWIIVVTLLGILTFLVLTAPQVAGARASRGRMRVRRPTIRTIIVITALEVVALLVLATYLRTA